MWVVKLGGSLAASPALPRWLEALAASPRPLVVVPGGGAFADAVRAAQARWRFDDGAAHRMALLAMDQYGLMLAAMRPELAPASSERALRARARAVWLPSRMLTGRADIPESWSVTSDSLAAWLAARLRARHLVLVKSAKPPPGAEPAELARQGLVDDAFPAFAAGARLELACLGPDDHERLARALALRTA